MDLLDNADMWKGILSKLKPELHEKMEEVLKYCERELFVLLHQESKIDRNLVPLIRSLKVTESTKTHGEIDQQHCKLNEVEERSQMAKETSHVDYLCFGFKSLAEHLSVIVGLLREIWRKASPVIGSEGKKLFDFDKNLDCMSKSVIEFVTEVLIMYRALTQHMTNFFEFYKDYDVRNAIKEKNHGPIQKCQKIVGNMVNRQTKFSEGFQTFHFEFQKMASSMEKKLDEFDETWHRQTRSQTIERKVPDHITYIQYTSKIIDEIAKILPTLVLSNDATHAIAMSISHIAEDYGKAQKAKEEKPKANDLTESFYYKHFIYMSAVAEQVIKKCFEFFEAITRVDSSIQSLQTTMAKAKGGKVVRSLEELSEVDDFYS